MSKVVIVGAGKTGRGFLARLLKDQEIVFIDKNEALINALNEEKKIDIDFFGGKNPLYCFILRFLMSLPPLRQHISFSF